MGKTQSIEHRITYSHKDTRSEARHGHLFINGNEIPDIFTLVIYPEGAFKFYQRSQLWGTDGYFPVEKTGENPKIKEPSAEIDKETFTKGWYRGNERLSGTPAIWLYVEWETGNAFVSPEKIKDMAAALELITIPRWKTPPLRMNK